MFQLSTLGLSLHTVQWKNFAKRGNVFDSVQRATLFNQRDRGVDKMPSIAKKRLLRKKFKKHYISALHKNKLTQTSGSVFAEKNEKAKKIKFNLQIINIVDCFLDGHGSYDGNLVSFKNNLYNKQYFLLELVRVMGVPKEYN